MNTDLYYVDNQAKGSPYIIERILGINLIGEIGVGVAIVNLEGRIGAANQVLLTMLGYSEPEVQNLELNRLIDFQEMVAGDGFFKKGGALAKGERYQAEKRFLRKDGRTFWVRLTVSLMREDSADDYFVVTVEDITRCKQAEEALFGEKKRLATTLGSIGAGVITTDIEGKIVLMNKAAEEITGWSQQEGVGMALGKVLVIRDQKTGAPAPVLAPSLLGNGIGIEAEDQVLIGNEGKRRLISFQASPIRNTAGECLGAVVIFGDTSQRRKIEAELVKSQKVESVGTITDKIAHDFNNILAGILANVQLAQLAYQKGRDITKNLATTEETVKRAADLTKQMLAFAKVGSPLKEVTSIAEIIKDTVEMTLQESNTRCECSLPENLWPVEADPGQLSQMMKHLFKNADQAMPQGGIIQVKAKNIHIKGEEVPTLKPGGYVQIMIRDTGIGIPEADLEKIFDPYFTTKKGSSGLGLTTSYSIIKRHDGYIGVTSIVGIGTTFEIYLPATLKHSNTGENREMYTAVNG